ncbi:putative Xre family DNA-binding protein [Tetragenococcus halophilus subsp. halophilus]|nr:zinc ribbon domain-containing protein [Tetragenococcus halophilus]GBD61532.1 putative Xre family DNA-binding protein [Tetragenococcus halophilus subsp. halophilus]GBD69669.1 putative Xre family DNA-binding protein [Tetragenococcus halophilus subsp. halophilus]GBD81067.1 putative Xre family DNA-binding protein [Tetragenococcus halophilus subsp. halophilus]GBD81924.1 putative Xre family DNA-binding protein [Tetragenococcus halophilus subsp. halophilus]
MISEGVNMEFKEILLRIRKNRNLSQEEMAERLLITRQAVSRWEMGETIPNIETLKIISKEFDVSINTLLGSPRTLICQCCGMPMYEDSVISKDVDGSFNEDYCKWCYVEGEFVYDSLQDLINFLVPSMSSQYDMTEDDVYHMFSEFLPKLKHWK